jgi:type IV pilus assembly protein PilB
LITPDLGEIRCGTWKAKGFAGRMPTQAHAMAENHLVADSRFAAPLDFTTQRIADEVLRLVTPEFARRNLVLPLRHDGAGLQVAVLDPVDRELVHGLEQMLGCLVTPVPAPPEAIGAAIEHWYGNLEEPKARDITGSSDEALMVTDETANAAAQGDAPIIRLVHQIIFEAVQRRASDIHLEPLEKRFRVRYRIDGALVEAESPSKDLQFSIVSRLKIMANISIAEKRVPQDGRIQLAVAGRSLDLRVSSLPTAHGESIVMRILDQERVRPSLADLGLSPHDEATVETLLGLPDGIVLVTGPTGSGKTTTLYSFLHALNERERKIITVEDPVEYQLSGINQVPVRADVGMTFAAALRAILRQAPNVVMVGEIRDFETAEMAIHASLTGHLVFSTLHTNDAAGAVTRLIDLGVKPFLLSSVLRASLAQRLVRKICVNCRQPVSPRVADLAGLQIDPAGAARATLARGLGCPRCQRTGYYGRTGLFEIMVVDDQLGRLVHDRAGIAQLREKARSQGMRSLREDGVRKVTAGLTTIEEVVSLTVGDPT